MIAVWVLIGFIIGGAVGIACMSLLFVASDADDAQEGFIDDDE